MINALSARGWAYLEPDQRCNPDLLAMNLGPFVHVGAQPATYQDLQPLHADEAKRGSMSSFTGTGDQPMHTDLAYCPVPPRYVVLQCLAVGEFLCPTRVWTPEFRHLVKIRAPHLRRAQWACGARQSRAFYAPVLETYGGGDRIRFDPHCMKPTSCCPNLVEDVQNILREHSTVVSIQWQGGGVLIIDNWRCLHARGSGAGNAPSRRLRRWYIGETNGMG